MGRAGTSALGCYMIHFLKPLSYFCSLLKFPCLNELNCLARGLIGSDRILHFPTLPAIINSAYCILIWQSAEGLYIQEPVNCQSDPFEVGAINLPHFYREKKTQQLRKVKQVALSGTDLASSVAPCKPGHSSLLLQVG